MEIGEDLETGLLIEPWKPVSFGSSFYIAKVCFTEASYALFISDLNGVWYEEADAFVVQERSQELNKRLKAPVSSFLKHLSGLMRPLIDRGQTQSATFTCELVSSKLFLRLKSELSGLPFYWEFRCGEASVGMISRHLLRPLMRMSLALESQSQLLSSLILRKDAEIQDYRESGATLSRGRLETEIFDENLFQENFLAQGLPERSRPGEGMTFTTNLQRLYTAITTKEVQRGKRKASGDNKIQDPVSSTNLDVVDPSTQSEPEPVPSLEENIAKEDSLAPPVVIPPLPAPSKTQNAPLPVLKPKRKKAKGLFT